MRLKLLKNIIMAGAKSVEIQAGSIVEASPETSKKWLDAKVAELVRTEIIETAEFPKPKDAMVKPPEKKKITRK